jgi:predicted naringenin-chalcone synthase
MVLYQQHAFSLAQDSARQALDESSLSPKDVTHLVTVSCTGFYAPGVDVQLMNSLALPRTVERTHVGFMGCHAAINGLRTAKAYAGADPRATVLLCAVELCSLHYAFRWDPQRMVGNALFADGAASVVGRQAGAESSPEAWRVAATGSCLLPDTLDQMSWKIGDYGYEMELAATIPDAITRHLRPWLESWLDRHGCAIDSIGSWAIHPGGPRIVEAAGEVLGLSRDATQVSRDVLAKYGNMSSPTVLFILDELRSRGAGLPCVMLAFGPGLMAEAALVFAAS